MPLLPKEAALLRLTQAVSALSKDPQLLAFAVEVQRLSLRISQGVDPRRVACGEILKRLPSTSKGIRDSSNLSHSVVERSLREMRRDKLIRISGWLTARIPIYDKGDAADEPRPPYDFKAQAARANRKRRNKDAIKTSWPSGL